MFNSIKEAEEEATQERRGDEVLARMDGGKERGSEGGKERSE